MSSFTLLFQMKLIKMFLQIVADTYLHCVCLMYYLGEVVATQAATAEPGDDCIPFISMLKLDNLHSDFKILVEVYTFQTQPKYLPHEKKYHISHAMKVSLEASIFPTFSKSRIQNKIYKHVITVRFNVVNLFAGYQ